MKHTTIIYYANHSSLFTNKISYDYILIYLKFKLTIYWFHKNIAIITFNNLLLTHIATILSLYGIYDIYETFKYEKCEI